MKSRSSRHSSRLTTSLGKGSARYGGNPASVGHTYAFGNTLEKMKLKVMGVKQRGHASDRPFDHATGLGYVAARNGDYVDALERKKLRVTLLLTEPLGGIAPDGVKFLGRLTGMADPTVRGTRDDTAYTCRSAPTFMAHHGMRISAESVHADALILAEGARRLKMFAAYA